MQPETSTNQKPSTMHMSTMEQVLDTSNLSVATRERMIINKRGSFEWLPVWHDFERGPINDLEVGSW